MHADVKVGVANLSEVDIHSVTGLLKLYFRELPEPLFTEASYSNFMDALSK
jgi:breakpoint cluster region protein